MAWTSLPFTGQAYTERSRQANAQDCVNLYPVKSPAAADPKRVVLYPTPGYQPLQATTALGIGGTGAGRGLVEVNGTVYLVSGSRLLVATPAGDAFTYAAAGTLYTSTGRCSIVCNTVELAISDGTHAYVYDLTTGAFAGVPTTGSFPPAGVTNLAFQDGYVLGAARGTSRLVQSDLLAAGTYPALAFADVSSFPDALTAVYSDRGQMYAFGPKQTEVRFNAASTPFAFEKTQGVLIDAGCVSWATVVKIGGRLTWLAANERGRAFVVGLSGYTPEVLSTPPLNEAFQRYATVADAYATGYREGDTEFYCLTFPSEGVTWALDTRARAWHRRTVGGGKDLAAHLIPYRDKQLALADDGTLYWMSQDYLTDGSGNGLTRSRTCSHVSADGRPVFVREVEIDLEVGFAEVGTDPQATLEVSRDRGVTWFTAGVKPLGRTGDTRHRLRFTSCGWGRDITVRLTVTDAARVYVYGARARLATGYK